MSRLPSGVWPVHPWPPEKMSDPSQWHEEKLWAWMNPTSGEKEEKKVLCMAQKKPSIVPQPGTVPCANGAAHGSGSADNPRRQYPALTVE